MRVELVEPEIRRIVQPINGPVGRDIRRRSMNVQVRAEQLAVQRVQRGQRGEGYKDGPHYHDSFFNQMRPGPFGIVSNTVPHANYLELGTKDHGPDTAPFLVFRGRNGGWVRTKRVRGISAYHILGDSLKAAAD